MMMMMMMVHDNKIKGLVFTPPNWSRLRLRANHFNFSKSNIEIKLINYA